MKNTRLQEKMNPNRRTLALLAYAGIILSLVSTVRDSWAICLSSDEICAQSIVAAQYKVNGILEALSDGSGETEVSPDINGNYTLHAGTVYRLKLWVNGNISSGYGTFTFTGSGGGTDSRCLLLAPSGEMTVISFRPEVSCSFRYEYCWGIPQDEAWDGEEITLKTGADDLVTIAVGEVTAKEPEIIQPTEEESGSQESTQEEPSDTSGDGLETETETSSEGEPTETTPGASGTEPTTTPGAEAPETTPGASGEEVQTTPGASGTESTTTPGASGTEPTTTPGTSGTEPTATPGGGTN